METGTGLWIHFSVNKASAYPPETPTHGFPTCPPCIPLGSPSCCSSLDKESLSTLCLAALERMKLSTATVAFTSPDSRGPQVRQGVSLWPQLPPCSVIFSFGPQVS